tara:strand:+ start:544 stop:891 length:348 start_codon:yes stop_codon:yes gene_type:complete
MSTLQQNIQDLIYFYVKNNYNQYLKDNKIKYIPESEIDSVISTLYENRKEHLKMFIKSGLKELLKEEYPGDLVIINVYTEIFKDDNFCKTRISSEIKLYQYQLINGRVDHSILLK